MNTERIIKLAEQAGDDWDHTLEPDKEFLKKFAELIVEQCAAIIDAIPTTPQGAWSDGYYEGCRDSAKTVREHFGIENEY